MGKVMRDHSIHTAMTDRNCDAGIQQEGKFCDSGYEYPGKYVSVQSIPFPHGNQPSPKRKRIERYKKYKEMLNIKANSCEDPITSLSGGNQQKVISCALAEYRCGNPSSGQPDTGNRRRSKSGNLQADPGTC